MTIKLLFFFNDTATTEIYTLSLPDALPMLEKGREGLQQPRQVGLVARLHRVGEGEKPARLQHPRQFGGDRGARSAEHTSELQSRQYIVCRRLLAMKFSR